MANIAKLAIKLVADMEQAQKDFSSMSKTITSIEKSAKTATPSMRNLTDAVKGLETMQGAVAKAQEAYNNEPLIETQKLVRETTGALGSMQEAVQRAAEGVGDDILNMKATFSNVQKAQGEVEKLIALQKEMGANGHLMDDAIKKAQTNMATLGNKAFQANTEMMMLKTTINGINSMPFMVMSHLLADLIKGANGFIGEFNQKFGGMPSRIAQVSAAVLALTVALGLATAKTTALGLSTTYLVTLWKSSVIYQGLAGVITLLNTILGTQIAITVATTAWVAVATLGIGALIAVVSILAMRWFDNSAEIRQMDEAMSKMEKTTQKAIERFRELNSVAKNGLEALLTPAEKLINRLKEIGEAQRAPEILKEQIKHLANQQQALAARIAENKGGGWFREAEIEKQRMQAFKRINEELEKLHEAHREAVKLTEEQAAAMRKNARIEYQRERYGKLIDVTMTAQEHYIETLNNLAEDVKRQGETGIGRGTARIIQENLNKQLREQLGIAESPAAKLQKELDLLQFALGKEAITRAEYAEAVQKAMEQWDPATKASIEATKKLAQEQERAAAEFENLVRNFKSMGKTPLVAFKELSVDLQRVRHLLSPAEFATAKDKLLADLANGLGVTQFLTDALSPVQQLAATYKNLEAYAREAGLTQQELTAAQNRARAALEKQSEYYSLYQRAQDAMLTTQEKLNRELSRIANEAKQWGWDKSIVAVMKELKVEELLGAGVRSQESGARSPGDQSRNAALEFGTVAYYEAQMKDTNKPLLDEEKKHTKSLDSIDRGIRQLNRGCEHPGVLIA